jgi:hypothetical protein
MSAGIFCIEPPAWMEFFSSLSHYFLGNGAVKYL